MVCIYCGSKLGVSNTRAQKRRNSVWRRRNCDNCGAQFTTTELLDLSKVLMVKGANNHLEPFSRDKLLISIFDSIKHRNAPENEAGGLCDTVVADLVSSLDGTVIKKHLIKQVCLSVLQPFDSTAGTYYRAYYR